jgi:thiol-disulfide isomerase/thioredoxin
VEVRIVRRLTALILICAALAVTSACSAETGATAGNSSIPSPQALQFTSKAIDGADFSGQSLTGKPAVLWLWAPWCPTCQAEAPTVAKAAQMHPTVTFLGVAAQDRLPAMTQFVAKYKMGGFTHLADPDALVFRPDRRDSPLTRFALGWPRATQNDVAALFAYLNGGASPCPEWLPPPAQPFRRQLGIHRLFLVFASLTTGE